MKILEANRSTSERWDLLQKRRGELQSFSRVSLLLELHRLDQGNTQLKQTLRTFIKRKCPTYHPPNFTKIEEAYKNLTEHLRSLYRFPESKQTYFERKFLQEFKRYSRRDVFSAFWIGGHCVDVFCPSYRSGRNKGLVFEIHADESAPKQVKNNFKSEYLHRLRLTVKWIGNRSVQDDQVRRELQNLQSVPDLTFRSRRHLLTRIYIETLAHPHPHTPDPLPTLLGIGPAQLRALQKIVERYKRSLQTRIINQVELPNEEESQTHQRQKVTKSPQPSPLKVILRRKIHHNAPVTVSTSKRADV